jgi:hypothetical protein
VNFEDEHYVRIYTRDTKTWLRWGWEGQAVFALTARKLDALGRLSVDDPVADVALLTGMPEDVVRVGLKRVLASGALVAHEGYLECPNWIDGQTATKSDSARCREYRARLKARRVIPRGERYPDTGRVEVDTKHVARDTPRVEVDTKRPCSTQGDIGSSNPTQPNPDQIRLPERGIQDLTGSARHAAPTLPAVWHTLDGWDPPQWLIDEAAMQGIMRPDFDRRLADLRTGPIGGKRGVLDRTEYVRAQFPKWRTWGEEDRGKERAAGGAVPARGMYGRAPRQGDHGLTGLEKATIVKVKV